MSGMQEAIDEVAAVEAQDRADRDEEEARMSGFYEWWSSPDGGQGETPREREANAWDAGGQHMADRVRGLMIDLTAEEGPLNERVAHQASWNDAIRATLEEISAEPSPIDQAISQRKAGAVDDAIAALLIAGVPLADVEILVSGCGGATVVRQRRGPPPEVGQLGVLPMSDLSAFTVPQLQAEIDRRMADDERAQAPPCYFFGVWPGSRAGHYLHDEHGSHRYEIEDRLRPELGSRYLYPWPTSGPDAPRYGPLTQNQGKLWHWHPGNVTVLTSWDRSEDDRGNCCATFVVEGHVSPERALDRARTVYPKVFARITKRLRRAPRLVGPVVER